MQVQNYIEAAYQWQPLYLAQLYNTFYTKKLVYLCDQVSDQFSI